MNQSSRGKTSIEFPNKWSNHLSKNKQAKEWWDNNENNYPNKTQVSLKQNSVKIHKTKCKFPQKNPIRLSKRTKITSYTDETDNQAKRSITYQ